MTFKDPEGRDCLDDVSGHMPTLQVEANLLPNQVHFDGSEFSRSDCMEQKHSRF
jgi:hypothetical protein